MSLGIYISVPFCRTKCTYCNFASDVFSRSVFERYVDRICGDIANAPQIAKQMAAHLEPKADSIYLGGGTPTVLDPVQLQRMFTAVRRHFEVVSYAEITVECAPGTLTPPVLDGLLACGVNRVSLGVQSFIDAEAASIGRLHKCAVVLDDSPAIAALIADELLQQTGNLIRLTPRGRLLSNEVFQAFLDTDAVSSRLATGV